MADNNNNNQQNRRINNRGNRGRFFHHRNVRRGQFVRQNNHNQTRNGSSDNRQINNNNRHRDQRRNNNTSNNNIRHDEQNGRDEQHTSAKKYFKLSRTASNNNDGDNMFILFDFTASCSQRAPLKSPFLTLTDPRWNVYLDDKHKVDPNVAILERKLDYEKEYDEINPDRFNLIECEICKIRFDIHNGIAYAECSHSMCINCCIKCMGQYQICPVCRQKSNYLILSTSELTMEQVKQHSLYQFKQTPIGKVAYYLKNNNDNQYIDIFVDKFHSLLFVGCKLSNDDCRVYDFFRYEKYNDYFDCLIQFYDHIRNKHGHFVCALCIASLRLCREHLQTFNRNEFIDHFTNGDICDSTVIKHVFCVLCGYYLFDEYQLWEHCKRDHCVCYLCNAFFTNTMSDMVVHYRQEHCYCPICDLAFEIVDLERHKTLHPNDDIIYQTIPNRQKKSTASTEAEQASSSSTTTTTALSTSSGTVVGRSYLDYIDLQLRKNYQHSKYNAKNENVPIAGPTMESYIINFPAISPNVSTVVNYPTTNKSKREKYEDNFPSLHSEPIKMTEKKSFANISNRYLMPQTANKQTKQKKSPQSLEFQVQSIDFPNLKSVPVKSPPVQAQPKVSLIDKSVIKSMTEQMGKITMKSGESKKNSTIAEEQFPPLAIDDIPSEEQIMIAENKSFKKIVLGAPSKDQQKQQQQQQQKQQEQKQTSSKTTKQQDWPALSQPSSSSSSPLFSSSKKNHHFKDDSTMKTLFPEQSIENAGVKFGVMKTMEPFPNMKERWNQLYCYVRQKFIDINCLKIFLTKFVPSCRSYYWNEISALTFYDKIVKLMENLHTSKDEILYRIATGIPDVEKQKEILSLVKQFHQPSDRPISSFIHECKGCDQIFMAEDFFSHNCSKNVKMKMRKK